MRKSASKESVSMLGGISAIVLLCFGDSRVGAAEEEEGASCWDGWNLLFDGKFRQPLGARPWWDFWKVLIILLLIGHCNRIIIGFFFFYRPFYVIYKQRISIYAKFWSRFLVQ